MRPYHPQSNYSYTEAPLPYSTYTKSANCAQGIARDTMIGHIRQHRSSEAIQPLGLADNS